LPREALGVCERGKEERRGKREKRMDERERVRRERE
jgi:hypothetical protein